MKKYATIFIGIAIIVLGILAFTIFTKKGEERKPASIQEETVTTVAAKTILLTDIPYTIEATGTLSAKQKIELYSEVQGVLQTGSSLFKVGSTYRRGQTIFSIDSSEHLAQVKSNRSTLINQIAAMMPDMELDYPTAYQKWQQYLQNFDVNARLAPLPQTSSEQEKLFVTGKNIYQTYYNVKNLEARLSKYFIAAPFSGEVTEALVNPGALVRSGQKLGEFIDNSVFELQLEVPASQQEYLKKNAVVKLSTVNGQQNFEAKVNRTSSKINQNTQTILVIVEVSGSNFSDGQFLKASIEGDVIKDAVEIPTALLLQNDNVYVVENDKLQLKSVTPIDYNGKRVIVKGLENRTILVSEKVSNASPGVTVTTKLPVE